MESASYAILLYPEEGLQFVSTPVDDEDQLAQVGFSEGLIPGWFGWSKTQGLYYQITEESEESVRALTQSVPCLKIMTEFYFLFKNHCITSF